MSTIAPTQSMIASVPPIPIPVPLASLTLCRLTVDEYERIGEAGAMNDPERVELIDGYMVTKMPKSPEHCYSTEKILGGLKGLLGAGWILRKEGPVRIPDFDEPEPDISVVRGSIEDYRHRHPGPSDVGLLAEVSLTTLDLDRGQKLSAYATAGILVYWIVNLVDNQIEVYTRPGPGAYQSRADYKPGQAVPVVIDGRHVGDIAVDDILP
jgi:Uma2 family endonuclease